jgi:MFS family permease
LTVFFAAHVASVLFLLPIAGFALLATAAGALPALGVILIGLGLSTEIDLIAFLTSRYFGQRAFGQLYGFCFMLFGLGSSFGCYIGGAVYDLAGSYIPALVGAAIALVDPPKITLVSLAAVAERAQPLQRTAPSRRTEVQCSGRCRFTDGVLAHVRTPGGPASTAQPLFRLTRSTPTLCLRLSIRVTYRGGSTGLCSLTT